MDAYIGTGLIASPEAIEKMSGLIGGDAAAGVGDVDAEFFAYHFCGDANRAGFVGVGNGVVEEVVKDDPQFFRIGFDGDWAGDLPLHIQAAMFGAGAEECPAVVHQVGGVDGLKLE